MAMINSFYWNRRWVFRSKAGLGRSGVRFLLATLVSIWIIQPGMVFLFSGTMAGQAFGTFWYNVASWMGIVHLAPMTFTAEFVIKTVAFGTGVVGSAIWNFTLYKLWAFKED
jgi:putative flippase GtrA